MSNIKKIIHIIPITCFLIFLCVVVYFVSFLLFGIEMNAYEGIRFGGYYPLMVYFNHEYYRLISANFIHFGIFHLLINCISLFQLGTILECSLSKKQYLILIIASMICTTGLPYLLFLINGFEMNTVSGGISGVIFGLLGSIGALALLEKRDFLELFKSIAPQVVFMLLLSWLVPTVSLSGHISGMIGGFVVTLIVVRKKNKLIH